MEQDKEGGRGWKPYLYPSAAIGQLVKAVRQLGSLALNKRVIKCSTMELLKSMDSVLKVCYHL